MDWLCLLIKKTNEPIRSREGQAMPGNKSLTATFPSIHPSIFSTHMALESRVAGGCWVLLQLSLVFQETVYKRNYWSIWNNRQGERAVVPFTSVGGLRNEDVYSKSIIV